MNTPEFSERLLKAMAESLSQGNFVRLLLSRPFEGRDVAGRMLARQVDLQDGSHLSIIRHYAQRTTTENIPIDRASGWLGGQLKHYQNVLLCTTRRDWQWHANPDGAVRLSVHPPTSTALPSRHHDHPKSRILDSTAWDWLQGLGVFNPQGKPRAGMADKYRQIERYLEIISHLIPQCGWIETGADQESRSGDTPSPVQSLPVQPENSRPPQPGAKGTVPQDQWCKSQRLDDPGRPGASGRLVIADMGCGKAYLTFGLWHLLHRKWGLAVRIIGVDAREDLIQANQRLAHDLGAEGLEFCRGDIVSAVMPRLEALLALHACDTATDDAIRRGIELGAQLVVVAPCCHKAIRPQLTQAGPLSAVLKHGLMEERLAEWITDGLRALFLEASGYRTKIIEFVGSEHTPKNLMITAIRQAGSSGASARDELEKLKAFFGLNWPNWTENGGGAGTQSNKD